MKVQILGTGCSKCETMLTRLEKLKEVIPMDVEKVENLAEIFKMGVMQTPGLVIDGTLISQGKVYKEEELKQLLERHC